MLMIRNLFQARCEDRAKVITVAEQPLEWIQSALTGTQTTRSFHFLVSWTANPPCIAGPLWMTRLLMATHDREIEAATDETVRVAVETADLRRAWMPLSSLAERLGTGAECVLLPEYQAKTVDANSPVWRVSWTASGTMQLSGGSVRELAGHIRRIRGGDAALGSKGLIYGTSAVECWLSRTGDIFPGDCDCLLCENDEPRVIIELKKHTLSGPIGDNLASKYYPVPDGRKFDALFALQRKCQEVYGRDVPIAVVYYATRFRAVRVQMIAGQGGALVVQRDSGDVLYQDPLTDQVGARIVRYVLR